jgi:hypothetical protein
VVSLNIDPEGNITVEHIGNLDIQTGGHATYTAQTITMNAETVTINADVAINGDSLTHNEVNVGDMHRHTGVDAGFDNTGESVS